MSTLRPQVPGAHLLLVGLITGPPSPPQACSWPGPASLVPACAVGLGVWAGVGGCTSLLRPPLLQALAPKEATPNPPPGLLVMN